MKNKKIERMVGISLLIAVMLVLQFLASVFPIKIGPVSLSLVLIPIVLGAATYGVAAGGILGGAFGVMTYIFCVNGMDGGGHMVFQASPIMCFFVVMAKGILCGMASGAVYKVLHKKNGYVAMLCAAIICPVVNTSVFLTGMFLFFMDVLKFWAGGSDVLGYVLSGLILINFLPELGINIAFSPAGQRILRAIKKN
ncbi:MAG: ECF transporter S component [Ruminococcaceae bacterium]|nr:ECF transporter S component [Oscillospiraceae bacterium]